MKSILSFCNTIDNPSQTKRGEVNLPLFLEEFALKQIPIYVDSAFQCLQMTQDREYVIEGDGTDCHVVIVDYQNSGVSEDNKKWSGGLQQMIEMKHNLRLTPLSVITNFMSNIEPFSRYKADGKSAIYGLSGTLGLDSSATRTVLQKLFQLSVCNIPTHKPRKLQENLAIMVDGGDAEWHCEIMKVIEEAVKNDLPWISGRAILLLCEDIKTVESIREHVLANKKWKNGEVKSYARSNSNEKTFLKESLVPRDIVIATNLAGRGTDIKVNDEVNKSGGLLCIITFLPRNRRVELQAFGRTARQGKPGSVRCVVKKSSLLPQFQDLDLDSIRASREDNEERRLNKVLQTDVKEVLLRETLFKEHCKFLKKIHSEMDSREEDRQIVENEEWGQWLQLKEQQLEMSEETSESLIQELRNAHAKWQPSILQHSHELAVFNVYHIIKFGNIFLLKKGKVNTRKAYRLFTKAIETLPRYSMIAYYYRALCTITLQEEGYQKLAIKDLENAIRGLDPYVQEIASVLQCVKLVSKVRNPVSKSLSNGEETSGCLSSQMQARMQILGFIRKNIQEAIQQLQKSDKASVETKKIGIFSLIPDADNTTQQEIFALWNLGMEVVYTVKLKQRFCWEGLLICLLGAVEIIGGVLLAVFTVRHCRRDWNGSNFRRNIRLHRWNSGNWYR